MANTAVSTWPLSGPAIRVPIITPTNTGGASFSRIPRSTEPRLAWARAEVIEVGMMVAKEVPTAKCMRTLGSIPSRPKISNNTGTITMPPPTPSKPDMMPPTAPAADKAITALTKNDVSSIKPPLKQRQMDQVCPAKATPGLAREFSVRRRWLG